MPSDYRALTENNERQLGLDTSSRKTQVSIYSDSTHFIYEILQNADDHEATEVLFKLSKNELVIEHNGEPFTEKNVKAITYFGKSTSRDDLVKTGRFGVGFKSVFAFTATPIIISGDERFKIFGLYRAKECSYPDDLSHLWTRIILPFNHESEQPDYVESLITKEEAYSKISKRLTMLNMNTLLFTRKIREIRWEIDDRSGHYLREDSMGGSTRWTTITDGEQLNKYLVFSRVPEWKNKKHKAVDIAFALEDGHISPVDDLLYVLFATMKETHLRFILNGPYRTNPSRETISEDDPFNVHLMKETCELIVESLKKLKDMGLLSMALLEALPVRKDAFPESNMFYPIFRSVREALMREELLPANDGTFIAGQNAKLARGAELMNLLDQDQLCTLFQSDYEIKWLTGRITLDRTPDLRSYLMNELDVDEVDPEMFARKLSEEFLAEQTDEWFIRFYKFLSGQPTLWDNPKRILRNKPILRLQDGSHVKPFQDDGTPNAFLPPPAPTDFSVVKREIASNEQARDFLKRLNLSEPDIFDDIVVKVLPKYIQPETDGKISDNDHKADIEKILRALRSDSESGKRKVAQKAKYTPFLRAVDQKGKTAFQKPSDIYFPTEKLKVYFGENADVWFLNESEGKDEWQKLGVENKPRFKKIKGSLSEKEKNRLRCDTGSTEDIEISDYKLDGLETFLSMFSEGTIQLESYSLILWDFLLTHLKERGSSRFYKGEYKWFYYRDKSASFDAHWQKQLHGYAWLPTNSDNVPHPPNELCIDDLPDSFNRDDELIDQLANLLEMKQDVIGKLAKEARVKLETLELVRQLEKDPEKLEQVRKILSTKEASPKAVFSTSSVSDPVRREKKISKQYDDAPQKEYEIRDRSVRATRGSIEPKTWLREQYTNDSDQMICQICEKEMPFKKRNGEYYFEAVEALSRDHFPKEHEAQFLALCPLCAAMYDEFVKQDDNAMEKFKEELVGSKDKSAADELTLPLCLGEHDTSIRFVETHWKDMKTILRKCG